MNRALLAFFIVIAAILLLSFYSLFMGQKRMRRGTLEEVLEKWGKKGDYRFNQALKNSIASYSMSDKNPVVDNITWHDLDMDRLYRNLNTTRSSCGDCILYDRLRNPSFSKDELEKINQLAEFFTKNKESRTKLQLILSEIGRDEEKSIYEQLCGARNASFIGGKGYIILAFLTLADIVFFFFVPLIATILIFPLVGVNIYLSLRMKENTEDPIDAFQAVLRMLKAVDKLEKAGIGEISDYTEDLKKQREELKDFRHGAFLVTGRNRYAEGPGEAILQYIKLFFHVDLMKFDQMLKALQGHEEAAFSMMKNFGFLDMALCVASYRKSLPVWCRPELTESLEASLEIEKMTHPLINNPVPNSVALKGGNLITGSNASGKSTFLRNVALCVLMAQGLDTVPAASYKGNFLRVMTSMALTDNLENGESYYVVEIRSLKRILEATKEETPILTIVDEVLRGTNTIERIASSSQILKQLVRPNVISLAATHDIELTYLLEGFYSNYHFEEAVGLDDVVFDYKLKEGRSKTRNAIRLLESFHYDKDIVSAAAASAAHFEETGEWKL